MSENLKDILSHLNPDIDQETLLLYLQGRLPAEKQHEVEKKMMDNDFDADAMEGLQNFKNKRDINSLVHQLNAQLKKKTARKEKQRKKLELSLDPWMIIAIVMILVLAVISFIVVRQMMAGN